MGLIASGAITLAFVAIVVAANASCPGVFSGAAMQRFMAALIIAAFLSIIAGSLSMRGSRAAGVAGRIPAGLGAGMLVQPSTAVVFALAAGLAAAMSPRGPIRERLIAGVTLAVSMMVGYTLAFSPILSGDTVARC